MLHHRLRGVPRSRRPVFVGGAVGVANATTTTPSGQVTVSLTALTGGIASAAAEGDVVLAAIAYGASIDLNVSMSTSGYTEVADLFSADGAKVALGVYWKRMGATPDTTAVGLAMYNTLYRVMAVQVWRGVNAATPMDVTPITATGSNSGVPNPPSITPNTPNAVVVAVGAAAGTTDAYVVSLTAPTGMDRLVSGLTVMSSNGIATVGLAAYNWAGGAYDPAVFGGGNSSISDAWAAVTLALRPD